MTSGSSGFRTNLLAVFSVVLALLAIFSFRQTSRDAPVALNWESLVPGQTTRVDLEGMLGKPAEVEVQDDMEWLRYPSGNTVLPHLFGFRNDILVMGDIHLDGTGISAEELGQRFGPPEKVAYSRFVRGARAFIWARQGVALIADWDTGRPYRIRRFESMSVEQFMGSWGRNLPESDPYRQ